MDLAFGDRLGLAALIVALFSLAAFYLWPTRKWIGWLSLILAVVLALAWGAIEIKGPEKKTSSPVPAQPSQQDLSGIRESLDEINKNLAKTGRPRVSAAQMDVIKQLDSLILGHDESSLRLAFGFPKMMENNIRMNIAIIRHFKEQQSETLDLRPYLGTEWNVDSELAEGRVRRFGGGFQYDPPDGKRVYLLALPSEYSVGKKVLFKFENSSELPTPVVKAIKDLDDTVYKNADKLLHVLNDAAKKDPDYYLRYDDQTSPQYFHQIDAMWLDNFIQLRPKADNIRDAVRQFLGVK